MSCSYCYPCRWGLFSLNKSRISWKLLVHIVWAIMGVIRDIWSHVCKIARLQQVITWGGNKWKWSEREKKHIIRHLAIYQTVGHWIKVTCYKRRRKHCFKAIFKGRNSKAFIVPQVHKTIPKTLFLADVRFYFAHHSSRRTVFSPPM